jgi:hypothetical protein
VTQFVDQDQEIEKEDNLQADEKKPQEAGNHNGQTASLAAKF